MILNRSPRLVWLALFVLLTSYQPWMYYIPTIGKVFLVNKVMRG